jgi:tungstate transport system substrate-binding protein
MVNVYQVIAATAAAGDRVNAGGARVFADFLVGAEAQRIIAEFGADEYGEPLFDPVGGHGLAAATAGAG